MEKILNYAIVHYKLLIVISIFLLFSLIGYFVSNKKGKNQPYKIKKDEEIDLSTLNVQENVTLSDSLKKSQTVGINNGQNSAN